MGEAPVGQDGVARTDAGGVAVRRAAAGSGGSRGRSTARSVPGDAAVSIGGDDAGQDVGLDLREDQLVLLAEVPAATAPGSAAVRPRAGRGSNQARLNQTWRSRSSSTVNARRRLPIPGMPAPPASAPVPGSGDETAPGDGRSARTCAPPRRPARSEELGGRLEGVLPVTSATVARGVVLQLLHQRRDQVEGLVEGRVAGQDLHHVQVVLEGVQPRPGHLEGPGTRRPVVRLVHVPDEGYVQRLRRRHPSPGRSSCRRAAVR